MKKTLFITSLLVWHVMQVWAQGSQISREIADVSPDQFSSINLFSTKAALSKNSSNLNKYVNNFNLLEVDNASLSRIASNEFSKLEITMPINGEQATLQLIKSKVYDHQTIFTVQNGSKTELANYVPGAYYSGVIKGVPNTLVAISFYDNDIIGVISSGNSNYVLGKSNLLDNRSSEYVLYNDKDLLIKPEMLCSTDNNFKLPVVPKQDASRIAGGCVKVYVEADNKSYIDHGSNVTNTMNWVLGIYNVTATLYRNESITTFISQIKVWATPDPYISGTNTSNTLPLFSAQMSGGFNGDLAHLFSSRSLGGGIAYLGVLCAANKYKVGVSANLTNAASPSFPTYSWNTMVVTHELGHNIGSKHTQACAWNGNNTAIDGCAGATEGGCPLPGNPAGGGTIMSYCHLTGVGINFSLGFGPQPGAVIRNAVSSAACIVPCCPSNVTITGNFSTPLTQSSSWIKSVNQTTIVSTSSVRLDADPTTGFIELKPVNATDFFLAAPSTSSAVFVAQALDGCGGGAPFGPNDIKDYTAKENTTLTNVTTFPNPFNSSITISFMLNEQSSIGISIRNIVGEEVAHVENQVYGLGAHSKELNLADLSAGIYFCVFTTVNFSTTTKIIKSN